MTTVQVLSLQIVEYFFRAKSVCTSENRKIVHECHDF